MGLPFYPATAEQIVAVVQAIVSASCPKDREFVSEFADITSIQAEHALEMSCALGFLLKNQNTYKSVSPISRLLMTPQDREKAAILRVMLESYEPYIVFRRQVQASGSTQTAAQQTKTILQLTAHREEIKDTLVNLATFSGALVPVHGGQYKVDNTEIPNLLLELAKGCSEVSAAHHRIQLELGAALCEQTSHENVLTPLANGLRFATAGSSREAVLNAGNAIDTFLDEYAARSSVSLAGRTGINSKLDCLQQNNALPKKLTFKGKYLGHIRNAADHGNDQDIGSAWDILDSTGNSYVFVACSFMVSVFMHENSKFEI